MKRARPDEADATGDDAPFELGVERALRCMKRPRPKAEAEAAGGCALAGGAGVDFCDACGVVADIAAETRVPLSPAIERLLRRAGECPGALEAYGAGLEVAAGVPTTAYVSFDVPPPLPPALLGATADLIPSVRNPWGRRPDGYWTDALAQQLQQAWPAQVNARHLDVLAEFRRALADFTIDRHDIYYDDVLTREEDHWYGPSGLKKKVWPAFDQYTTSRRLSALVNNPKWAGKTDAQIREQWDAQRLRGSAVHKAIDKYVQHLPNTEEEAARDGIPVLPVPPGVYSLLERLCGPGARYEPFGTEVTLVYARYRLKGQADFLVRDKVTGKIHLCDFKTHVDKDLMEEMAKTRERGTHPFTKDQLNCKLVNCEFQLNLYWLPLKEVLALDMADEMFMFQFRPDDPEDYYVYRMSRVDMARFVACLPYDPAAACNQLPKPDLDALLPLPANAVRDDDPAAQGPTTRTFAPKGPLPPDVVWTGKAYSKGGYALPDSPWKAPFHWFGPPPADAAHKYERYLLGQPALLQRLPELHGKRLACWCRKPEERCNADVLCKYANACANGAFALPSPPS